MRLALCDDDPVFLGYLASLIRTYSTTTNTFMHIVTFASPLDFLSALESGNYYDFIFLDILMPHCNGIDVAKEIRIHNATSNIIFLTSSPEFALEGYQVHAYHYLLKSFREEDFFKLLNQLCYLFDAQQKELLVIKSSSGIYPVPLHTLVYCEVIGKSIYYHLQDTTVLQSISTLKKLSTTLDCYSYFIKPHRSYVVNMHYIYALTPKEIILSTQSKVPIARGNYKLVESLYFSFCFKERSPIC